MLNSIDIDDISIRRQVTHFLRTMQATQPFGRETDPIVRTFGHLSEGRQGKFNLLTY